MKPQITQQITSVLITIARAHFNATLFPYTTLFRSLSNLGRPEINDFRALSVRMRNLWVGPRPLVSTSRCGRLPGRVDSDRKSTRLNSSHGSSSYAVFCLKKKIES